MSNPPYNKGDKMLSNIFGKYSDYSTVVLRVALGLVLIWHGLIPAGGAKLLNIATIAGYFESSGLPIPIVLATIAAVVEGIGGLLLIAGVLTRAVALLVSIQFAIIILLDAANKGIGIGNYELPLLIFAAGVALLLTGSKALSLERILFKKELI
jgi:putative oxidoreductase